MKTTFTIIFCTLGLLLAGCSHKPIDGGELRSQIERAQRLARECVLFLDLRDQRHLTASFFRTHADYLNKQAEELQKEIRATQPKPEIESVFDEYRSRLGELSQQTARLDSSLDKQHLQELDRKLGELESRF